MTATSIRLSAGRLAYYALLLVVTLAAALAWFLFARKLENVTPVPHVDVPQPNAVVWRSRVYQSSAALAAVVERRGGRYSTWATNHPAAAQLLARLDAQRRSR